MSHIEDRLKRIYLETNQKGRQDWIPKRYSTDPIRQLKRITPVSTELSQNRASEILQMQRLSGEAARLIREEVEETLIDLCGTEKIDVRMAHFEESWEKAVAEFYEEYNVQLIEAMLEMAGEGELVGYEGFIDRKGLKKKLKEIRKRDKDSQ